MNKITRMGIDLGKNQFHVCAMDRTGRVVMQKQFTRRGLEKFLGGHEPCVVGMEACGGAHHWARRLRALGYDARLMSAQFVKAYVKSNKNDWRDAEAICEAVGRPTMRFVPVKTVEQQSIQHLHRARSLAVSQRTALANQMRGFLFEYGLVLQQGIGTLRRRVVELVEDAENGLPMAMRELLMREREEQTAVVVRFECPITTVMVASGTPAVSAVTLHVGRRRLGHASRSPVFRRQRATDLGGSLSASRSAARCCLVTRSRTTSFISASAKRARARRISG